MPQTDIDRHHQSIGNGHCRANIYFLHDANFVVHKRGVKARMLG